MEDNFDYNTFLISMPPPSATATEIYNWLISWNTDGNPFTPHRSHQDECEDLDGWCIRRLTTRGLEAKLRIEGWNKVYAGLMAKDVESAKIREVEREEELKKSRRRWMRDLGMARYAVGLLIAFLVGLVLGAVLFGR